MLDTSAKRADRIADALMECLPSPLEEVAYLTHTQRCALAAVAGCEMDYGWKGSSLDIKTKYEILILKPEDGRFWVYERKPGEQGKLKARVSGKWPTAKQPKQ